MAEKEGIKKLLRGNEAWDTSSTEKEEKAQGC